MQGCHGSSLTSTWTHDWRVHTQLNFSFQLIINSSAKKNRKWIKLCMCRHSVLDKVYIARDSVQATQRAATRIILAEHFHHLSCKKPDHTSNTHRVRTTHGRTIAPWWPHPDICIAVRLLIDTHQQCAKKRRRNKQLERIWWHHLTL